MADNSTKHIKKKCQHFRTNTFEFFLTGSLFILIVLLKEYTVLTGDENYDLTDLTVMSIEEYIQSDDSGITVHPNPFNHL